jgi:hypothetical protein
VISSIDTVNLATNSALSQPTSESQTSDKHLESLPKINNNYHYFTRLENFESLDDEYVSDNNTSISKKYTNAEVITNSEATNNLSNSLKKWAITYNIQQTATSELLHLLNEYFPKLQYDSRSLLKTPRNLTKKQMGSGHYIYVGLKSNIEFICNSFEGDIPDILELSLGVDGVPMYKDSPENNFWVILGRLRNLNEKVFLIAIYRGKHKPENFNEFLNDFVEEFNSIKNGIFITNKSCQIKIVQINADSPARCDILGTRCYNSKCGCFRCEIEIYWVFLCVFQQNSILK